MLYLKSLSGPITPSVMMKKSFYNIEKTTKICSDVSNLEVGVLLYYALLILIAKLSTLLLKTCPYQLLGSCFPK
jgi:hypothetical protein